MITLYGKQNCGFCTMAIQLLENSDLAYEKFIIDENITREEFVTKFPNVRTVPYITIEEQEIGGYQQLKEYVEKLEI